MNLRKPLVTYYTAITFILICCFGWMVLSGKYYIFYDIGSDTYCNNWPNYAFFRERMLSGNWSFWSDRFGLGADISINVNSLFDPFNVILFLFPSEHMPIGLMITAIVKYYVLAALAFHYMKLMGLRGLPLIIGSLCYTFSGYFVGWGQHYPFASAFCLFTLTLISFELFFRSGGKQWRFIPISVALLAMQFIYTTYMTLLFLAVYSLLRLISLLLSKRKFFLHAVVLIGLVLLGMGLSAFSAFPQIQSIMLSSRVGAKLLPSFSLGDMQYYSTIFNRLLSSNTLGIHDFMGMNNYYEAPFLYAGILWCICMPTFFSRSNFKRYYIHCFAAIFIILMFPNFISVIMNAFSTAKYRWTFCLVPIFALLSGKAVQHVLKKDLPLFPTLFAGGIALAFLLHKMIGIQSTQDYLGIITTQSIITISAIAVFLIALILYQKNKMRGRIFSAIILMVVVLDLGGNCFIANNRRSLLADDYSNLYVPYFDSTSDAAKHLEETDSSFYRISKTYSRIDLTDSLIQDYRGEKHYLTAVPGEFWSLLSDYNLLGQDSNYFYGMAQNEMLRSLLCGKYCLSHTPIERYGYHLVGNVSDLMIYENEYALPLGIKYTHAISESEYEALPIAAKSLSWYGNLLAKDDALLESLGEAKDHDFNEIYDQEIAFDFSPPTTDMLPPSVGSSENSIVLELSSPLIRASVLSYDILEQIGIFNIQVYAYDDATASWRNAPAEQQTPQGRDRSEIMISEINTSKLLVYSEALKSIDLNSLTLRLINHAAYEEKVAMLKESAMELISYTESRIEGRVTSQGGEMLFLAIPYNQNWKAYVDGEPRTVYEINRNFLGVQLFSGDEHVVVKYESRGFYYGSVLSLASLALFILLLLWSKRKIIGESRERKKAATP